MCRNYDAKANEILTSFSKIWNNKSTDNKLNEVKDVLNEYKYKLIIENESKNLYILDNKEKTVTLPMTTLDNAAAVQALVRQVKSFASSMKNETERD